jgi:hypothetical protein
MESISALLLIPLVHTSDLQDSFFDTLCQSNATRHFSLNISLCWTTQPRTRPKLSLKHANLLAMSTDELCAHCIFQVQVSWTLSDYESHISWTTLWSLLCMVLSHQQDPRAHLYCFNLAWITSMLDLFFISKHLIGFLVSDSFTT